MNIDANNYLDPAYQSRLKSLERREQKERDKEEYEWIEGARAEAERFVNQHAEQNKGATQEEINAAIGKIARALWELGEARRRIRS